MTVQRRADQADEIAAAWRRERPGMPTGSIGVVTRIWQIGKLLADDRARLLAELGIDRGTMDLLSVLRRAGSPYRLTTRQLTERAMVTAGAISQRVARAERDGLVARVPGGEGRRAVTVALTDAGRELIDGVVEAVLRREYELIEPLGPERREHAAELLADLLADLTDRLGPPGRTDI